MSGRTSCTMRSQRPNTPNTIKPTACADPPVDWEKLLYYDWAFAWSIVILFACFSAKFTLATEAKLVINAQLSVGGPMI